MKVTPPGTHDALFKGLRDKIDNHHVQHLMNNSGHANGYSVERYLKNDEWQRRRYLKTVRALKTMEDFLYF